MDPWMSGGIISDINESVVSVILLEGAHHLDLRAASIHDPAQVVLARQKEEQHIRKWIKEANNRTSEDEKPNGPNILRNLAAMFDDL